MLLSTVRALMFSDAARFLFANTGWGAFRQWVASLPILLQVLAIMFFTDLVQYWVHRAFHRIPWLWRFHAVHHSAQHMDWMAGARMHFLEILALRGTTVMPMMLLGFHQTQHFGAEVVAAIVAHDREVGQLGLEDPRLLTGGGRVGVGRSGGRRVVVVVVLVLVLVRRETPIVQIGALAGQLHGLRRQLQVTPVPLVPADGPYVAVGTPQAGVAGFRLSYRQAEDARIVAVASGPQRRRFTAFSHRGIALAALLGSNVDVLSAWATEVLGPLACSTDSDQRLRETLQAFLKAGGSNKAAAEELHLHTNSVKYRVQRAIERRGRPIEDDRLDVEVALLLCSQFGDRLLDQADDGGA